MFAPVVETRYGKLRGDKSGKVCVWRGIPYAKPPLGMLRFRPPQVPEPWDGVREAKTFGPSAMQSTSPVQGGPGMSEDCLYLNIWSPQADDRLRPVMMWIHGGAFVVGSSAQSLYDGSEFAANGDVVVVSINYRLGAFGFLYLDELSQGEYPASGNLGLLDQVAALRWVRENISVFGGDPERVTIFGESAGATSVGDLLAMPAAKGLFKQAIIQSMTDLALSRERAAQTTSRLMRALDLGPDEVSKLATAPAEQIQAAAGTFQLMTFAPVADGTTFPDWPEALLAQGSARGIPVLIGSTEEEFRLFTMLDPSMAAAKGESINRRLAGLFGPIWPEVARQFPVAQMDRDLYTRILTYYALVYPTLRATEILSHQAPVWAYQFRLRSPLIGAGHGYDLPFVWHNIAQEGMFAIESEQGRTLSDRMHDAWIAFARRGNPSTSDLPEWPRFTTAAREVMIFDAEPEIISDPYPDRPKWERLASLPGYQTLAERIPALEEASAPTLHSEGDYREGYFSVRDKIGDIMKNEQGAALLAVIMEQAGSQNPGLKINKFMLRMIQGMSLQAVAEMAGERFPPEALQRINAALMQIKKEKSG